jgi:aerobic carbon-monoxide dehydrogenase medium subunit
MLLRSLGYGRPGGLGEAVRMLAENPSAKPLAGGQSLLNVLKHRAADVEAVIDISRLEELRGIDADGSGGLEIGAACTYEQIADSEAVAAAHPKVAEVANGLVDQQVRCRGTIGGNACFNDPGSNYPPLLVALEATMRISGESGDREVAAEDFFRDTYRVDLGSGELLRSVVIAPAADTAVGYSSLQFGEDSWAVARAAVRLRCNGTIAEPRVVIGCVSGAQPRAEATERALEGIEPSAEAIAAAAERADEGLEPATDAHASSGYRRKMARVMAARAVSEAIERAGRGDG